MSQYVIHGLISYSVLVCILIGIAMTQIKRHRIDWDNIPIVFVPADTKNPNHLNRFSRMTPKEREWWRVAIAADIWIEAIEKKLKNEGKQNTA